MPFLKVMELGLCQNFCDLQVLVVLVKSFPVLSVDNGILMYSQPELIGPRVTYLHFLPLQCFLCHSSLTAHSFPLPKRKSHQVGFFVINRKEGSACKLLSLV